jgi:hypothetical protein
VKGLDRVHQRWTVALLKDVWSNLDHVVRTKAEELPVEGAVMQGAEREAVADEWLSSGLGIGNDVGRVEQLLMTEAAEGALPLIGLKHPLTKGPLVQTAPNDRGDVAPARAVRVLVGDARIRGRRRIASRNPWLSG